MRTLFTLALILNDMLFVGLSAAWVAFCAWLFGLNTLGAELYGLPSSLWLYAAAGAIFMSLLVMKDLLTRRH